MTETVHTSVLTNEILHFLQVKPGMWYVDATLGGGGHTIQILKLGGKVLGLDQDQIAIDRMKELVDKQFHDYFDSLKLVHGNFADLGVVLQDQLINQVAGVVFDLGMSSDQLDDTTRGFSFTLDSPLDMRFDQSLSVKAVDLVNGLSLFEMVELFVKYGEVYKPKLVASAIISARKSSPIKTTKQLSEVVMKAYGQIWQRKIHPATQVFQAFRMAVNDEVNSLESGLSQAIDKLMYGGRICVISFHSIEDRLVKVILKRDERLLPVTDKPVVPKNEEIKLNPRSSSAKLRVAEKIR